LILFLNSTGIEFEIIILASSANNIELANLHMVVEKSFIYMRNSNGPNTELCVLHVLHVLVYKNVYLD
jgi:hypothetical protein